MTAVTPQTRPTVVLAWACSVFALGMAVLSLWPFPQGRKLEWPLWLGFAAFAAVGGLLAVRRAGPVIGWLMLGLGTVGLLAAGLQNVTYSAVATGDLDVPGFAVWTWLGEVVWGAIWGVCVLLILLFPTGAPASRRWRPLVGLVIALIVANLALTGVAGWPHRGLGLIDGEPPDSPLMRLLLVTFAGFVLSAPLAAVSFVLRFRRATGVERAQLKWFALAAVLMPLLALDPVLRDGFGVDIGSFATLFVLPIPLLPITAGLAILRYRLYDIDRIVSRTIAYALLTAALGLLYLAAVVTLGAALRSFGGSSDLAVAGSTLAVAAAFGPLRRRLQALVDRRFNRMRYDAERTVEVFRHRLRGETQLDEVTAGLVAAVRGTVEPAGASVWLRVTPGGSR